MPSSFAEPVVIQWLETVVNQVAAAVATEFDVNAIKGQFAIYKALLAGKSGHEILRWYSGKDLFGVLASFFQTKGINNSADAMERVANWLVTPRGATLASSVFPEWKNLGIVLSR